MTTAPLTQIALAVEHLHVRRGGRDVLRDVSLSVEAGETLAVAGPNGGGKTSLALAILGFIPVDEGRVSLGGDDPARAVKAGRLGYVPQRGDPPGALPVTPMQVLHLAARRGDEAWVNELAKVALVDVPIDRPMRELSGGQHQLVVVARSLAHRPSVVLLDEPTLGLAPAAVGRLVDTLAFAREQLGTAFVVNTHDHLAAMRLSNRLLYLDREVRYDGPANEVPPHLDARLCHHA